MIDAQDEAALVDEYFSSGAAREDTEALVKKLPPLFCEGCNKPIPNRKDRKTNFCKACSFRRCPVCGVILPANTTNHDCKSVDLKQDRHCVDCGKPLSSIGYERWKNSCPQCEKRKWREKNAIERKALRVKFGGKCCVCGYDRCFAALHFHHIDNSEKYEWSNKGNASLREIKAHPERFQLLCANCHIELHEQERDYQHQKVERSKVRKSREHYKQEVKRV